MSDHANAASREFIFAPIDLLLDGCHACRVDCLWKLDSTNSTYVPHLLRSETDQWVEARLHWPGFESMAVAQMFPSETAPVFPSPSNTEFDAFHRAALDCMEEGVADISILGLVSIKIIREDLGEDGSDSCIPPVSTAAFACVIAHIEEQELLAAIPELDQKPNGRLGARLRVRL